MMYGAPERISLASVLEWDCYRVIAYFSFFRYPLTSFEVWKWLYNPEERWSLAQVIEVLSTSSWLGEHVVFDQGFYGLSNDTHRQVHDRHDRLLDALRKYRTLRPVLGYLGRLPFIGSVMVCNSLAYHHTSPTSDIDLFIVTEPGRVWTTRLLAVSAMALLRKRPGETAHDPVCCSFFVDKNTIDLTTLKIAEHDPYLALWVATLVPLIDRQGMASRMQIMNSWVKDVLPNVRPVCRAPRFRPPLRKSLPGVTLTEDVARSFQERRFPEKIRSLMNQDTRVVVNERMLKFHENDRRAEIIQALEEKLCI